MQPSSYHPVLLNQLHDAGITDVAPAVLELISSTYASYDTQLAQRTNQLIASTAQAYSFLDSIHKGFIMCDTSGEVVLTNNSLRSILSVTPDAQLNLTVLHTIFGDTLNMSQLVTECRTLQKPIERAAVNLGVKVVRINFAPLMTGAAPSQQLLGVVILVEDITEQKMLERSKDEFLSIASHELRTPLTAIRGNASLIQKYYAASIKDDDMAEMIADIHESSVRLIGIVNDFLDVAAIEQGKISMQPEAFYVKTIIGEVVRELRQLCEAKGVKLISDVSVASAPEIHADKQRIKQVIINLVGNAIKFTDQGSITISTSVDAGFAHIRIIDTGKGMSPENQKLLFRKFQQAGTSLLTRDTTKGTGLGLYISKLIVELSGGSIGLEQSVSGEGSTFGFTLPLSQSLPTGTIQQ